MVKIYNKLYKKQKMTKKSGKNMKKIKSVTYKYSWVYLFYLFYHKILCKKTWFTWFTRNPKILYYNIPKNDKKSSKKTRNSTKLNQGGIKIKNGIKNYLYL